LLHKNSRKAPVEVSERIANSKVSRVIPTRNHAHRKMALAAICLLTIVAFGALVAALGSSKTIVYASSVTGLGAGIYWDQACTNKTLSFNWGAIEAGSNKTVTIYVENEGNSAASLSLETSNWNPSTSLNYMSLSWNYSGQVLGVGQVVCLELTLTAFPTISTITNFSFDTTITTK
jgi:hypothetical protein